MSEEKRTIVLKKSDDVEPSGIPAPAPVVVAAPPDDMLAEVERQTETSVGSIKMSTIEERSIQFGIVGVGQGGSRLAESFYSVGRYPTVAVNSASQDLTFIKLPEANKLHMDYSLGGAGQDMGVGEEIFEAYKDDVEKLLDRVFGEDVNCMVACVGLGGGTGSGSIIGLIDILSQHGLPVIVICTLPLSNEGALTKNNAIRTLDKLAKLSAGGAISGLVVIDNAKIEQIYPNLSESKFWEVANASIIDVLDGFNKLTSKPSKFTSLDPMDFAKVMTEGNCTIFGKVDVKDYMDEDAIARALTDHLKAGLLADGFNLEECTKAGIIFVGNEAILNDIPAYNINFAISELSEMLGGAGIFKGIYSSPEVQGLQVLSMFSGLGVPRSRVNALKAQSEADLSALEEKQKSKASNMSVLEDDGTSDEKKRFDASKRKRSPLGKMMNSKRPRGR